MATAVNKSSKINFYKFVQVKEVSSSASAESVEVASVLNSNTKAINNLGGTLNSFGKVLTDLKKIAIIDLEREQKENRSSFKSNFADEKGAKRKKSFFGSIIAGKAKGFFESILGMLGGLFKFYVGTKALKWLSNPKNRETVKNVIGVIAKIGKFIFDWAKFGITTTIDSLYTLLSDDTSWWEKTLSVGKLLVGVGTLLLGARYLSNPLKIVTDIGRAISTLIRFATGKGRRGGRRRGGRLGGALRLAAGAGLAYGSYKAIESLSEEKPEEKANGGKLKKAHAGGWINGPQSGYKVSLDGGRSTSFIGHGKEYVARKADGGAFVVPFNTPATQRMSGLTSKRIGEAKRGGYKLPGFSQGGYLDATKRQDNTQGDNANKKIFLHWSAGNRNATNFNNGYGYHTYIPSSGKPVRRAKYGATGAPHHTYGRNKSQSAAIGVAGMSTANNENASSFGSQAITPNQYKGMAKESASIALNWGWKPSDITEKKVRTHAEEYRDYPNWYHRDKGSHYRWDLSRLYAGEPHLSGGPKIRAMIKEQMGLLGGNRPSGAKPKNHHDDHSMGPGPQRGFMSKLQGAMDAMTGGRTDFDGLGSGTQAPPAAKTPSEASANTGGGGGGGGGMGKGKDFWTLAAVAGTEDNDAQGWADVAQSVYKRKASGVNFNQINGSISGYLLGRMQYEPTWKYPRAGATGKPNAEWHAIKDADSAARAMGKPVSYVKRVAKALQNKALQKKAASFVGGRTDFMGGNEVPRFDKGDVRRKANMPNNFFGWFVGGGGQQRAKSKSAAGIPGFTGSQSGQISETGTGTTASGHDTRDAANTGGAAKRNLFDDLTGRGANPFNRQSESYAPYSGVYGTSGETYKDASALQKATQERNAAKQTVLNSSRQLASSIMGAATGQNQVVMQQVQQAMTATQSSIQKAQSTNSSPALVGGGGGGAILKTTAAVLNSFNNPLKGIL
jgi:hypothetical protein